jgi:membrane fusion protein, hemolysin D
VEKVETILGKRSQPACSVCAEVKFGSRTVMEYLLSPVQKVTHEAGREM